MNKGGPEGVSSTLLRELGVYGGAQGIWVDKARTSSLTQDGSGHKWVVAIDHQNSFAMSLRGRRGFRFHLHRAAVASDASRLETDWEVRGMVRWMW
jgi:hypothetical protein